ncbi:6-phosphogluconate dehydrogenase C-terminal domain-like protein [Rhizodiscina lignyota]|uniref:3-hydroxyisobutyrate dehydrogenase n=1 Tax=Rhizodiscina lignyota TaxID=1504668 RepID=A0A9P4M9Z7_9PEZI|nr:6-phosphogluconate dehydrogenase C-terminal domain-like protein [Rhizodiscina lignyota]
MENNVGFIGIGAMGFEMAMNVRKKLPKAYAMYIYDIHEPACYRFKEQFEADFGAVHIASSPKHVAENAHTIISIVPSGVQVREIYLDSQHGVAAAKSSDSESNAERLYVESSTIDIETAKYVSEQLYEMGMGYYVDAPGGVPAATKGDLSFMMGAPKPSKPSERTNGTESTPLNDRQIPPEISARLQQITAFMGDVSKVFYCGAPGSGLAAKLANNYISCTICLANAEAMALGIKLGVDKNTLFEIIEKSTGQNFMLHHVCPVPGVVPTAPSSNGYRLGFKAQMLSKDVRLAADAARSVGLQPTIGDAALSVFDRLGMDERYRDKDGSIVYKFIGGTE